MRRALLLLVSLAVLSLLGLGAAVATTPPRLAAAGPTSVSGTDATAVFTVGDRRIRQVRYRDKGRLVYTFRLASAGRLPVTVTGLAPLAHAPRLFHYLSLTDTRGARSFTIPAGGATTVRLTMRMHACETLSARAGSFATQVALRTSRAAVLDSVAVVRLPEEVHTGSPREAYCPGSTATSRPPG